MTYSNSTREDMRATVTKSLLTDALFNLLGKTPFSQISVTLLCQEARIHRTSFYKHFVDKDALLEYAIHRKFIAPEVAYAKKAANKLSPKEHFSHFADRSLDIIFAEKNFYHTIFCDESNYPVVKCIFHQLTNYLTDELELYDPHHIVPPALYAHFTAGGILTFLSWCFKHNSSYSKAQMIHYLSKMISFP